MSHTKSVEETLSELGSSEDGLSEKEAELRLSKYGPNEFGRGKSRSFSDLLVSQFKNYILILLIIAALVSFAVGQKHDAFAIGVVVILNVLFGMALEYQADRSMEELRKMAETSTIVKRGGAKMLLNSRALVPGDVIFLEEGLKIPADARILQAQMLEINEASLTGESMPVKKNAEKLGEEAPLAERSCMLFAGTFVTTGTGIAVVVSTGSRTEFGKLERTLGDVVEEETTLQKTLGELGKTITIVSFAVVAVLFAAGLIFGKWTAGELLVYSISVIVAAVPEGMLTILTIVLAIGVRSMASEKALVRKLHAVETLGNITFIATDKTGTLTEGRMALVKIYDGELKDFAELDGTEKILSYAYLCNSAHITEKGVVGDETDRAILIAGIVKGVDMLHLRKVSPSSAFTPFDSTRKLMSGVYRVGGKEIAIVKGAPETVLDLCGAFEPHGMGTTTDMGKARDKAEDALSTLASAGMRVIAVAYYAPKDGKAPGRGFTLLGFLALHDPLRRESRHILKVCNDAGIRVMMITGDNLETARRIGAEAGLAESGGQAANWIDLEKMDDEGLDKALETINVVARATPLAKLRIVERMVKRGEIVAVTGDGVNDAPALKKAHVAVVMGKTGTEVSKSVADVILTDDNFATLEKAIEYGRTITQNIINFLKFQITTNFALVLLSIPYVFGIRIFEPIGILWINLIIDGPPALTLGLEKPSRGIMGDKPRKGRNFIDNEFMFFVANTAIYMAVATFITYFYYQNTEPLKAGAAAFTIFAFMQVFNALNCRSRTDSFYSNIGKNKWLLAALAVVALAQISIVSVPELMDFFGVAALSLNEIAILFGSAASVLLLGEAVKLPLWVKRK